MHITSSEHYNAAKRIENSRKGGPAKYTRVGSLRDRELSRKSQALLTSASEVGDYLVPCLFCTGDVVPLRTTLSAKPHRGSSFSFSCAEGLQRCGAKDNCFGK